MLLQQAVLEIRYSRGLVYLDRCGSLAVQLQDVLQPPFFASVPDMNRAEVTSPRERLSVVYSAASFVISQLWMASPVRALTIAKKSWATVADSLSVQGQVTRIGARFTFVWAADSGESAQAMITKSGLIAPTASWTDALGGAPAAVKFGGTRALGRDKSITFELSSGEFDLPTRKLVPPDLEELVPRHAVVLDVDRFQKGEQVFSVGPGQAADFFRDSWSDAKNAAERVSEMLGTENAGVQ